MLWGGLCRHAALAGCCTHVVAPGLPVLGWSTAPSDADMHLPPSLLNLHHIQVTAIHAGTRNLLRIRMPGKAPPPQQRPAAGDAAAAAAPTRSGAAGGARSDTAANGGGTGCALDFLAGLADDMRTPREYPAAQQQQQPAAGPVTAPGGGVALLSRALVRDAAGAVAGASCKFILEPGASVPGICRKLSAWGLQHRKASIEDFEAVPAEQVGQAGEVQRTRGGCRGWDGVWWGVLRRRHTGGPGGSWLRDVGLLLGAIQPQDSGDLLLGIVLV